MTMVGTRLDHKELREGAWDVIVVGAGPAGSRAAEAAARGGAKVLVFERRKEVGVPVQCAEFLHRNVVDELAVPSEAISQDIVGMLTHVDGGVEERTRGPGCILDRAAFDTLLAERAEEAGATILLDTPVASNIFLEKRYWAVEAVMSGSRQYVTVKAKVIIGADGPHSMVGGWIGQMNTQMLMAHQVTVGLKERSDMTEVFLHPGFQGGYGWLFPKGDLANIGVGVDLELDGDPKRSLKALLDMLGDRIGDRRGTTGGAIPVNGPLVCSIRNVMLCGDAGGFTHPITGGGIHQAVKTGEYAGRAAARYVKGDVEALDRYVDDHEAHFGRNLGHAVDRRREMVAGWKEASRDGAAFERLMRRCWIGFREYNAR